MRNFNFLLLVILWIGSALITVQPAMAQYVPVTYLYSQDGDKYSLEKVTPLYTLPNSTARISSLMPIGGRVVQTGFGTVISSIFWVEVNYLDENLVLINRGWMIMYAPPP